MKVAFWSNSKGRSGVTSNLACIGMLSHLEQDHSILLFENHNNIMNLGSIFQSQISNEIVQENRRYYVPGKRMQMQSTASMEKVLQRWDDVAFTRENITRLQNEVPKVCYIPRAECGNQEFLEYQLSQHLVPMLQMAEELWEDVYMDVSATNYLSSQSILQLADVVVVNLTQDPRQWEHFFRNYSQLQEKALYVIGNYNEKSIYNKDLLCRMFHVNPKRCGVIPYNIEFADAMMGGYLVPFLQEERQAGFVNLVRENVENLGSLGESQKAGRRRA